MILWHNIELTKYIYILVIPGLSIVLLLVNILFSTNDVYSNKTGPFECGLSSFTQTRSAFSIAFILIALLFLPFDLEVSSILPFSVASYATTGYGLAILLIFILILCIGFIYEFNKEALIIKKHHIKPVIHGQQSIY
jgi:NADH-ubiquinone oxidoreductase chain 3